MVTATHSSREPHARWTSKTGPRGEAQLPPPRGQGGGASTLYRPQPCCAGAVGPVAKRPKTALETGSETGAAAGRAAAGRAAPPGPTAPSPVATGRTNLRFSMAHCSAPVTLGERSPRLGHRRVTSPAWLALSPCLTSIPRNLACAESSFDRRADHSAHLPRAPHTWERAMSFVPGDSYLDILARTCPHCPLAWLPGGRRQAFRGHGGLRPPPLQ